MNREELRLKIEKEVCEKLNCSLRDYDKDDDPVKCADECDTVRTWLENKVIENKYQNMWEELKNIAIDVEGEGIGSLAWTMKNLQEKHK